MKTSSAKAKGRRLAQRLKKKLLAAFRELQDADLTVTPSGVPGDDITKSPFASQIFPYPIECKNQERINIWASLAQLEARSSSYGVLVFSKNMADDYACLKLDCFLMILSKLREMQIANNNRQP